MKKTVVAIAAGLIIAGSGSTQAFAAEYKVQDGDSLWKISNENNVSIKQLKEDNNLSSDIIFPNRFKAKVKFKTALSSAVHFNSGSLVNLPTKVT